MATINYFMWSKKKGNLAPIYVRLCAGRNLDFITKTGENIKPEHWSQKTQSINQRIYDKEFEGLKDNLNDLRRYIEKELGCYFGDLSKEWLDEVIYKFHTNKSSDAESFMGYIERFIKEVEQGKRKNEHLMNLSIGTLTNLKAFKNQIVNYQKKRTEERKRSIKVDFENVNIDFYNDFVSYLSDEGFAQNTIGKHVKTLKMFMSKSLEERLHTNRDFQFRSFKGISRKAFNIYLDESELNRLYQQDLSESPDFDKARDAFLVLCETGLRISDYSKVDIHIKSSKDGIKLIQLTQGKTDGEVFIPVSARLDAILKKYKGTLPKIHDQYINRDIKKVAKMCKINDVLRWNEKKLGKTYEKTCKKWEKITCHTGRRTFCTNAYLAGIPTLSIMQISGHSTESNFLKYIKVIKEQNALKMVEHPYFTKMTQVG